MKKFLSVLLALVMVFSTVAFALPSAVTVADTADETEEVSKENADLMGAGYKVKRGINMLTGTKSALTGENYSTYGGLFNTAYGDTTIKQATNPKDPSDKVFVFNIPSPAREDRTGDYVNFRLQFGPWISGSNSYTPLSNYMSHKHMYVAFDVMKEVVDPSAKYTSQDSFWVMNSAVSSGNNSFLTPKNVTPTSGWQHFGQVYDLMLTNQEEGTNTGTADPTQIIFHMYVDNANETDVNFYFDNMIIAPAYKVTYYNKAGTQVVKEDYIATDANGNLLSAFEPQGFLEGGSTYSGWSLTQGGTPVTSIVLDESNNSDIVLYATTEVDAFEGASIVLSDKLTKVGQKVTAAASLVGNPEMDADSITWSVDDSTVLSASKNKDGSATLKALKQGSATLTYKYSNGSITKTVTRKVIVATEPIVDPTGTNLGIDLDTYEYMTLNVTNTSGSDKEVSVRCRVTLPGASSQTTVTVKIAVPAGAVNMDVYKDLTETANWEGTLYSLTISANSLPDGVTVNNKKLWAKLSTELGLKFTTEAEFIGTPGSTLSIGADVDCDLEGVYDKSYGWTYNITNNCATVTEEADGTLSITAGENKEGFVTVTAKSNENSSVSVTRRIFVKTGANDSSKAIAYKWNLNDTAGTNGWYNGGGHHNQSKIENGTATLVKTVAKLNGASSATAVSVAADGKLTSTGSGSISESGKNSTEFVLSDYPYFCFTAKTTNPGAYSLKLYVTADGVSHSESRAKTFSVELSDTYQIFAVDVSSIANSSDVKGKNYDGIMFVNLAESVIDASTINSSNVASTPVTYSVYKPVIVDEFFFANYDASDRLEVGVNLTADKYSLAGDGTITLTSEVFASKAVANKNVVYSADSDIVTVFNNGDGTATVTPVGNGTVTITAKSAVDENATDSVTLTISGVKKKLVAYELSMVSLGNSYLCHNYAEWFNKDAYNGWINADDVVRGMAASEPDLDYYGRIQYYVNKNFNCSLKANRFANNLIEIAWMKGLKNPSDTSNHTGFDYVKAKNAILDAMQAQLKYIQDEQTNIITIQLAENARFGNYGEIATFFYDTVFSAIDEARPEESVVVVITPFGSNAATSAEISKAIEYGFYVANCTDMTDKKWQAYDQYPDFNNPNASNDFRSHPGDLGMDEIGKRVFAQLEKAIPTTIAADYIYVPDSISITGGNAITTDEGTLQLGVAVEPSENSTTDVLWSVDNENVATIDENGLLTAVNNGTVKVTAVCAYDEEVKAVLDVTVSGQMQAFTLTYACGTTDTVTNLPASDPYAKGEYVLSTAAPERNGYKFKGWSLTENGTPVKTVAMDSDKTVYAVWEFATEWNFDEEGNLEGIGLGGFHTYCRYEEFPGMVVATVTSYGDGVSVFDNTLLVPSADYNEFVVKLQPNETTSADMLNLTITNDAGTKYNYSLPMTTTAMAEYAFDISDVEGTITGFMLKPTVVELSLYIDYIKFAEGNTNITVTEDTTADYLEVDSDTKIVAGDYTYTVINDVTVSSDATLYLEEGTYIFKGNLAGKVVASPNANVVVKGDVKPEGYVEIELGENNGTRYAEVNGIQLPIKENEDFLYGVIADKNLLVQIVDKGGASLMSENETEDVLTTYYHVNVADGTYTELPMGNYMNNVAGQDLRAGDSFTDGRPGLRFKAQVSAASKLATEYTVTEYGYIIGLEETINANGGQLNFELKNEHGTSLPYVYGKGYVRGEFDKVFENDDDYHVFAGVLIGAPNARYEKNLVAKTYTKVTIGDDDYVIYGEPMVANFLEIALSLKSQGGLTPEIQDAANEIITSTMGPDIGFDWGEL